MDLLYSTFHRTTKYLRAFKACGTENFVIEADENATTNGAKLQYIYMI